MGEKISIGLAGLGNVGAGVYKNLEGNSGLLTERTGHRFEVSRVAVRDISRPRDVEVPPGPADPRLARTGRRPRHSDHCRIDGRDRRSA